MLLSARTAGALLQGVMGVLFARSVAPAQYGVVVACIGAVLLWLVVCDFGLMTVLARARAEGNDGFVAGGLRLNRELATLGAAVAVPTMYVLVGSSLTLLVCLLLVASTAIEKVVDTQLSIAVADGSQGTTMVSLLLRRLSALVLFGCLLYVLHQDPVVAYGVATLAGAAVGAWHAADYVRRRVSPETAHTPRQAIMRSALPFLTTNVAVQSRSLDVSVVALTDQAAGAGAYAAAAKLTAPFSLVTSTLATLVLPFVARGRQQHARRYASYLMLGAVALTGLYVWPALVAGDLAPVLLGKQYRAAGGILAICVIGVPLGAVSAPLASILQALHREKVVAWISVVSGLLTLVATFVGAAVSGAVGAAVGANVFFALRALWLYGAVIRCAAPSPS
jgi:O-antigen/teichoic acid export membrane protein